MGKNAFLWMSAWAASTGAGLRDSGLPLGSDLGPGAGGAGTGPEPNSLLTTGAYFASTGTGGASSTVNSAAGSSLGDVLRQTSLPLGSLPQTCTLLPVSGTFFGPGVAFGET